MLFKVLHFILKMCKTAEQCKVDYLQRFGRHVNLQETSRHNNNCHYEIVYDQICLILKTPKIVVEAYGDRVRRYILILRAYNSNDS